MKIKTAEFHISAPELRACPNWNLPEFAFIGRSNVGKSSLINLLTQRKALAMTSATPGKTKLINFFRINGNWCLVDLPGYGYAKVAAQSKHEFNQAVAAYLEKRANLATVFVLIDSRHEPQRIDLEFLRWLSGVQVTYALVFTKTDKQSPTRTRTAIETFLAAIAEFTAEVPPVYACSSVSKDGRDDILRHIGAVLTQDKTDAADPDAEAAEAGEDDEPSA
jgi:GTP-binding protein